MKPYPKYRDSGVEWIGEVPEGWGVEKIKWVALINPSKIVATNRFSFDDEITFLAMENVGEKGELNTRNRKKISDVLNGFTYFEKSDVIVAKITPCFENGKGASLRNLPTDVGFGSTEFHVLRPVKIDQQFLFYVTKSNTFMKLGEVYMTGAAGQRRVPNAFIENFALALPEDIVEQSIIATYIDRKTAQIDDLIAKKHSLIALLTEERAAVINQAVTKGLDPSVQMKDSGVEWIGEIPEGWDIVKLKFVSKIRYGLGQPPRRLDNGLPIIRATNVSRGQIVEKDLMYVDPKDVPYDRDPILRTNDIIVVRSGAYTADSAIISDKFDGAVSGYDMVVRAYEISPQFLAYALLSDFVLSRQLYLHRLRAAQPHLNAEELGDTLIIVPPSSQEQITIAAYIDDKTAQIDQTITKTENQIKLLQEYRTTLISEAVTGKIDVRQEGAA
jgi:restriction endonuclease S subunit